MADSLQDQLIGAIECHDVAEIRAVFKAGLDPNAPIHGRPPVEWMTEMYLRSPRFPACMREILDAGGVFNDRVLLCVLLDDGDALAAALRSDRSQLARRVTLRVAFTPLADATLLHVAAEFGHLRAIRALLDAGADVNARAGVDADGMNGHTPLFHTVNSILNHCEPAMRALLDAGGRADVQLKGLVWGRTFEWETTVFDVTPISYAQMGLLPQFHRNEMQTYETIKRLLAACGRQIPALPNVPNKYLKK